MEIMKTDLCSFSNSLIKIFVDFKFEENFVTSVRDCNQFVKFIERTTRLYKIDHFENWYFKTRVFETGLTVI